MPKPLDIWNPTTRRLLTHLWNADVSIPDMVAQIEGSNESSLRREAEKLGLPARRDSAESRKVGLPPLGSFVSASADEPEADEDDSPVEGIDGLITPVAEINPPVFEKVTILNLTESTCKWPIGEPSKPDFFFCGRKPDVGIPYCAFHARIAYQPSEARRRERDRKASGA